MVDAVCHNIANSQRNGYKASRPVYATQGASTHSGSSSLEVGIGVQVARYATDDSQGPLAASSFERNWAQGGAANAAESWIGDGVVELSNTDVGESLVDLILAEELFSGNVAVIETADSLLGELVYLGRGRD